MGVTIKNTAGRFNNHWIVVDDWHSGRRVVFSHPSVFVAIRWAQVHTSYV